MEERWVDYTYQETQLQIELSDMVFDRVAYETADVLLQIQEQRIRDRNSEN